MYIISVIFISLLVNFTFSHPCPPSEDIFPCTCHGFQNYVFGWCVGLTSLNQLKTSIRGFSETKFEIFTISNSSFDYIPSDLFENVTIRNLVIKKSNFSRIANIGEPQFQGLEKSLESLSIDSSFTRSNPFAYVEMSQLEKLRSLELWNNHVEVLHNEWFRNGPTSLQVVKFSKGKIRAVGFRALQLLPNLKAVDLSENEISYLSRSVLPSPASFLQELYLQRNKLDQLPDDFFDGMPKLIVVNLELNQFSTIDQSLWKPVWSGLLSVNIDYNPLVCDAKIKWIYEGTDDLEGKLTATCYKPFNLMDRELHSLTEDELK